MSIEVVNLLLVSSAEDLIDHIRLLVDGRLPQRPCVDPGSRRSAPGDGEGSPVDNSAAAVDALAAGRELRRQFIRNKTVTCNDGSKAGYVRAIFV